MQQLRAKATVSFGLIERLTGLLLCVRCLGRGVKTPVSQVVSHRHQPRALCPDCRSAVHPARRMPAPVVHI